MPATAAASSSTLAASVIRSREFVRLACRNCIRGLLRLVHEPPLVLVKIIGMFDRPRHRGVEPDAAVQQSGRPPRVGPLASLARQVAQEPFSLTVLGDPLRQSPPVSGQTARARPAARHHPTRLPAGLRAGARRDRRRRHGAPRERQSVGHRRIGRAAETTAASDVVAPHPTTRRPVPPTWRSRLGSRRSSGTRRRLACCPPLDATSQRVRATAAEALPARHGILGAMAQLNAPRSAT